eukprot:scaffold172124_cov34-Prasinocladus_malaysianus.AAC.1
MLDTVSTACQSDYRLASTYARLQSRCWPNTSRTACTRVVSSELSGTTVGTVLVMNTTLSAHVRRSTRSEVV